MTVTLTNTGRLPKMYLRVSDRLPRRLHTVGERAPMLLQLRPGETREVTYSLEAERRGVYQIGPAQVETTDPLGFYAFTQRVGGQSELAVYPAPLPLRRVFFAEAAAPGWRGQEAAQVRGSGTDFHGVREYQPGDELRHVHWRTTARTGTLSVAEYEQGASRDTVIALDLSRAAYARLGAGAEDALEAAVTMAVSLSDFLLRQGHAVRLLTPGDADDPAPPAAGRAQMPRILDALVRAEADSPLSLAETLTRGRLRLARGTTLLYITPAADDPALASALDDFTAQGAQVFGLALLGDRRAPCPPMRARCGAATTCSAYWKVKKWRLFPLTNPAQKSELSLPLYVSGLVVTLCGVLTVAYTVEDADFTTKALLLTLVGFAFSVGCRALRINSRVVEWLCLGLIALAVYGTLTQRVDWSALMPTGTDRNDTKLAVLLCWAAVLRSWVLFSDDAVLSTPLLVFAAIGLVSSFDLNTPVAVYFCVAVVTTTFLLSHYHALRQRALASPSERAREMPGLVPAQLGLSVLCGLAVIGLGCVLIVPLEAVSRNLSLAGAIRQLANLGAPAGAGANVLRFSDDSTLMVGTGEGWSASPQVLMRVAPDDGQPHLWRGRTYDRYFGAGWAARRKTGRPVWRRRSSAATAARPSPCGPRVPGAPAADGGLRRGRRHGRVLLRRRAAPPDTDQRLWRRAARVPGRAARPERPLAVRGALHRDVAARARPDGPGGAGAPAAGRDEITPPPSAADVPGQPGPQLLPGQRGPRGRRHRAAGGGVSSGLGRAGAARAAGEAADAD